MRVREPFDYAGAIVVMLAGLVVVGGLEAAKALRRIARAARRAAR